MLLFLLFITLAILKQDTWVQFKIFSAEQGNKSSNWVSTGTNERKWVTMDQGSPELSPHVVPTVLSPSLVPDDSNLFPLPWVSGEVVRKGKFLDQPWELGSLVRNCWEWSSKISVKIQKSNKEIEAKRKIIPHFRSFHKALPCAKLLPYVSCSLCGNHRLGESRFQTAVHFSDYLSQYASDNGCQV